MSQKSLIDRLIPYAKDHARTGTNSVQDLISEALDEMFEYDAPFMKFIDPTDNEGYPPYLQTTAGQYKYEITADNLSVSAIEKEFGGTSYPVVCRQVNNILVDVTNLNEFDRSWGAVPYNYTYGSHGAYTQRTTRVEFAKISVDSFPDMGDGTNAYIVFKQDPGTTTDKFFVDFLWTHPPLLSESIPLCMPKTYEKAIEAYVLGKIKRRANGKMSEDENRFYTYWMPRFRQMVLSAGAQINNSNTIPVVC